MSDTTHAERILGLLEAAGEPLSPTEIAKASGVDYDVARQVLGDLVREKRAYRPHRGLYRVVSHKGQPLNSVTSSKNAPIHQSHIPTNSPGESALYERIINRAVLVPTPSPQGESTEDVVVDRKEVETVLRADPSTLRRYYARDTIARFVPTGTALYLMPVDDYESFGVYLVEIGGKEELCYLQRTPEEGYYITTDVESMRDFELLPDEAKPGQFIRADSGRPARFAIKAVLRGSFRGHL